jgi:hypothetical protein
MNWPPYRFRKMEYRGFEYTVVQGVGREMWKWSVTVAGLMVMGQAHNRAAAIAAAGEGDRSGARR